MPSNAFRIVVTPSKSDGFSTIDDDHKAEIVLRRIREAIADAEVDVRKVRHVPLPSRFHSTPLQIEEFLREHFAEDVILRYQRAVGGRAVEEAARDIRQDANLRQLEGAQPDADKARAMADLIDPAKGGGYYPAELVSLRTREANR